MSRCRSAVVLTLFLGLCIARAAGQPAPALNPPPPIALKQGQSIEITLAGQNLGPLASAVVADARGLSAQLLKSDKPGETEIKLKLSAAPDAALGDRELRLIGPSGATHPIRAFVSQYLVIPDQEPNNLLAQAQEVALPATLVGRLDVPGDVDQFRFHALKGQQLVFDVHAIRLGSPLQPVATIHAVNGREKPFRVEHREGDAIVLFDVPEDGPYVLRLRDLQYRGGGDYEYRIVAGQIPYLESLLPSSGEPGRIIEARAVGYNLGGGQKATIDLSMVPPGIIPVRTKTDLGWSNEAPFEVTELPQTVESGSNDKLDRADAVSLPAEVSGRLDKFGAEGFFKFHLAYRQAVNLEVLAGRFGSPVMSLLQLRNAKGEVIESNDGTPDADARIARELDAGDYVASVRDLTYAGGTGHWYRLKIEPAAAIRPDFALRFLPDAPRLHRGGNVAIWCEVKRFNGFKGDVTISPEGLPAGVSAGPVTLGENASGWFTLAAAPDAALGTTALRLQGTATIGTVPITHDAQPEIAGRVVRQAYLTVLNPAPFNVEAVAMMTPQRIEQMNGEIGTLAAKLSAPDPKFDAALAAWEKTLARQPAWVVLNPAAATSSKSTALVRQPDGSVLATGNFPAQDQYTITAHTDLKGITAVRLEALTDDRLPAHGPGAAPNGNFVLSEFKMAAAIGAQPAQAVAFRRASADFSQNDFPVAAAIDNNPATGWAIDPQQGRGHVAVFETSSPVGSEDGATLTFVLDQQSPFPQHNVGRFRISVTTADPSALANESQVPANVLAIARTPRELRSSEQAAELVNYFRSIDPDTAADRNRLEALRSFVAPYAESARLEQALKAETPQLEAEQAKWEQAQAAGEGWSELELTDLKSANGTQLVREPDGSVFASGNSPPTDTYTLQAQTPLKGITAIRLEVLPDARLRGNGPGRAENGNFVLTRFRTIALHRGPTSQPSAPEEIAFAYARASAEQQGYGIAGALDDKNETGWAILPDTGRPAEATFYPVRPIGVADGSRLTFILEQLSAFPQHTIGRLRIWATTNPQPDAAVRVPRNVGAILKTPAGGRSEPQKRQLAAYFRSIAPSLEPLRQQLADLRAGMPTMPIILRRGRPGAIPVPINRSGHFRGDVQVTLEGYSTGRENDMPGPIARSLKLNPLTIPADKLFGTLTFEVERRAETGARLVVLKAESKIGNDTVTEYSRAFPITIEK